eukprot:7079649-Ditylum_brightwellii.AAC.1
MHLSNLQCNNFFTSGVQMGLTDARHDALNREGLTELETAFRNARAGITGVPGIPIVAAVAGGRGVVAQAEIPAIPAISETQATPIPAKCLACFIVASCA